MKMRKNDYLKNLKIPILIGILLSFLTIGEVSASHFRYGHITWEELGPNPNGGFDVEFTIQTAWRRSAFGIPNSVGQSFDLGMSFGDGNFANFSNVVTAVSSTEDWSAAVGTFVHTYQNPGNYIAFFEGCCRLGGIENTSEGDFYISTGVTVGTGNRPPVSNMPAIVNLPENKDSVSFFITAFDEDNDEIRFRLATEDEVVGPFSFDFYAPPAGLAIDAATGLVTWNTLGNFNGDIFTLSVIIEDIDDNGIPKSYTQLDFFLRIVGESVPPIFISPTPPNETTFVVLPGDTVTFTVQATDPDGLGNPGGSVQLNATGTPASAALTAYTPSLPTVFDNPVSTTFSWVPTMSDLGVYAINFAATDDIGAQSLTVVNISVGFNPIFNVPPTPGNGSISCTGAGEMFSQTIEVGDLDTTDVVDLDVELVGVPPTMPTPPFTPGGGFPIQSTLPSSINYSPALPLAPGNPVSTMFNGTVAASDWGIYALEYTSTDTDNDQTTLVHYIIIDEPPQFTTPEPTSTLTAIVGEPFSMTISATDPDIPFGDAVAFADPSRTYVDVPAWLSFNDDENGNLTLSGTPTLVDTATYDVQIELHDRTTHFQHTHCTWQFQNFNIYVTPIVLDVEDGPSVIVTGVEVCTTVTVTDDNGNPLADVAVDVLGSGANSYGFSGTSNADGEFEFCYTGTNAGTDLCVITAGDQTEEIMIEWVNPTADAGCTLADACNFDPDATAYDGSCEFPLCYTDCNGVVTDVSLLPGTLCDDGDASTIVDVINGNCTCEGLNINGLNCVITCDPESVYVGTDYCFIAVVTDTVTGMPLENVSVNFEVEGANSFIGAGQTDSLGQVELCYPTINVGFDTITVTTGDIVIELTCTVVGPGGSIGTSIVSVTGAPDQDNEVGMEVCTTVTIENDIGEVVTGVTVTVDHDGVNGPMVDVQTTDIMGEVSFCYTGINVGQDMCVITADGDTVEVVITWVDTGAVLGCTNADACNYDANATMDDGTCIDCDTPGETITQACNDGNANTENDMETILTCNGSICVPCQGEPIMSGTCIITAANVEITCNDSGTVESSDDTFTFTVFPVGNNTGSTYSISGDVSQSNISYGTASVVFGPFPASTALQVTITDDSEPNCSISETVISSCIGVPTLSQWGLIILALILLNLGVLYIRQNEMKPIRQNA